MRQGGIQGSRPQSSRTSLDQKRGVRSRLESSLQYSPGWLLGRWDFCDWALTHPHQPNPRSPMPTHSSLPGSRGLLLGDPGLVCPSAGHSWLWASHSILPGLPQVSLLSHGSTIISESACNFFKVRNRLGFILVSFFLDIAFVLQKNLLNWRVKLCQEAMFRE